MNIRHVIGALALGLAATQPAWAGPEVDSHARDGASGPQGMLSSMDKYREQLADAGVEFSLTYDGDLWGVASEPLSLEMA